ncbi:unnamed protein product, partial [Durusdinium trenchii]
MTFGDSPFHRHLLALSAEYERVVIENGELRKEMQEDGSLSLLRLRRQEDSPPPLQPITAYVATPDASTTLELPGIVSDSLMTLHDVSRGVPAAPGTPSAMPKSLKRQGSRVGGEKKVAVDDEETEAGSVFLLLLDVIPAVVILLSAAIAGISLDNDPEADIWKVFEVCFTLFFIGETWLCIDGLNKFVDIDQFL